VIKLRNESMFQPVHRHFRQDDDQDRLYRVSASVDGFSLESLTDRMVSKRLFPLTKLFGRKARSDPDISIMFRTAITESMRPSWKRSTMS
jgi:hypothetical protein